MRPTLVSLAATLFMALGIAACGAPESGTIVGKRYVPPSSHTETHCSMYASNGTCKFSTYDTVQDPEEYQLKLRNGEDQGWRHVSASEYLKYHKGQQYP